MTHKIKDIKTLKKPWVCQKERRYYMLSDNDELLFQISMNWIKMHQKKQVNRLRVLVDINRLVTRKPSPTTVLFFKSLRQLRDTTHLLRSIKTRVGLSVILENPDFARP